MSIEALKARIPDFAKDVRLNLSSLASDESLGQQTKWGLLLAVAISTRNAEVARAIGAEAASLLSPEAAQAARAAASIMAMNNVYYRFVHLASNKEYGTLPAKLRMNVIGNPGVPKTDFELWSLAVSAINGCGMCIDAHEKVLRDHGVEAVTVQTAVRYAAILQSVAVAIEAGDAETQALEQAA
ncbi:MULTISPECIES: carboxymuconolactone decarboxylase family protein [unclassified Beijerinckia]|uniref:carboxymuconolactone decarboxylase family protein n=1 Tax=unclassified Beijerinckia TaxID=2638183 RepID=UPI0008991B72|nr:MULTISPECIES: carboxymuconolactone decarboxylase family protein [unclassified Beijerinckia]MDH7799910.1 alkyl hydroperoxide reductase subunit D [Beijerinckia sp. GAS462]SED42109.1 alkyl hydroperoxide reductase subunit D [Beijerinckia sp. 28-YEA-48]